MDGKLHISYVVIGAYGAFVLVSSLLVGLLPPFVNRPICNEEPKFHEPFNRSIHNVEQSQPNYNDRLAQFKNKYPGKIEELSTKYQRNLKNDGYKICPELFSPEPGVLYPWYNPRLPDRYVPVHYDVELFVPQWGLTVYDGFIDMKVDITREYSSELDKYILVHAAEEIPILLFVKDKEDNDIEIDCVGEYNFYKNDYFIIKTKQPLNPSHGPLSIEFLFIAILPDFDSGIFEFQFGPIGSKSTMLASKFEPIEARNAFPCFDEPRFKPTWSFKIDHPKTTTALFNSPAQTDIPIPTVTDAVQTVFTTTRQLPSYLIGMVVFDTEDFVSETLYLPGDIRLNIWVRKEYAEDGLDILNMAEKIFEALMEIFKDVDETALPPKIDMFIIPEYPFDAIPHYGLPIFREKDVLFKFSSASESDKQRIALLIAKNFAEFWFGNFVTFSWWDELWLQEGLADYIKYRAVDLAYPTWNILQQFITEELINVLVSDGYPSSHPIYKPIVNPYEIEEYFDEVEKAKTAAIFRMVEEEVSFTKIEEAFTAYLNAHPWGVAEIDKFYEILGTVDKWPAKDFFDRWITQSNYPLLNIKLVEENGAQKIHVVQSRALNSYASIFAGDLLYPSAYNFTWYIPLTCSFGRSPTDNSPFEKDFYIEEKEFSAVIPNLESEKYVWVHCDRKFAGYYATDYTVENWENLGSALKAENRELLPEDRANIIHNLFVNGFTERTSYVQVVDVLSYLTREKDYLPWKTLHKHISDMVGVLDYKEPFLQVSSFFTSMMRKIEADLDLWTPGGSHVDELLRETIISLACRIQDSYCLKKTSELWEGVIQSLLSGTFDQNRLPPYVREIVFNYHIQNTYNVNEWDLILKEYENIEDFAERRRLLESLTFTRLPWLLSALIEEQKAAKLDKIDLFDTIRLMSMQPIGREICWDYYRINFRQLIDDFGQNDARIGQMLLDITKTFENEFLFYEVLELVFFTESGATANARFRALEVVSTNTIWLFDKEREIIEAFGDGRKQSLKKNKYLANKTSNDFITKAREEIKTLMAKTNQNDQFLNMIKKVF